MHPRENHVKVLLLCSAFNGLSQRAWIELRGAGHDVPVQLGRRPEAAIGAAAAAGPGPGHLPVPAERVPAEVWQRHRTIIIHPGPPGRPRAVVAGLGDHGRGTDLGGDRAAGRRGDGRRADLGLPDLPVARRAAAQEQPLQRPGHRRRDRADPRGGGQGRRPARSGPELDYGAPTCAAGSDRRCARPTARSPGPTRPSTSCAGSAPPTDHPACAPRSARAAVSVYDAHPGPRLRRASRAPSLPAATARCWSAPATARSGSATSAAGDRRPAEAAGHRSPWPTCSAGYPRSPIDDAGYREISYRRDGPVGVLDLRLLQRRHVHRPVPSGWPPRCGTRPRQDTRVLVLRGGEVFSNGIHLDVIEAAPAPGIEAWHNINAIDDVCREIITCTGQLVVSAVGGNAGAGGVMLALGADRVLLRDGVVLNPHYRPWACTARSTGPTCCPAGSARTRPRR